MEEMEVLCSDCGHTKKFPVLRLKREDWEEWARCEWRMMPPSTRLGMWRLLILPVVLIGWMELGMAYSIFYRGLWLDALLGCGHVFTLIFLWWIFGIYGDWKDSKERERDTLTQQTILRKYGFDKDSSVFTKAFDRPILALKESTIIILGPKQ